MTVILDTAVHPQVADCPFRCAEHLTARLLQEGGKEGIPGNVKRLSQLSLQSAAPRHMSTHNPTAPPH
jgi:hypothetical protein